jgi:hypothetical protein
MGLRILVAVDLSDATNKVMRVTEYLAKEIRSPKSFVMSIGKFKSMPIRFDRPVCTQKPY